MAYSPKQLLQQDPNSVREAILTILTALVAAGVIDASGEVVASVGLAISVALGLFYVRPLSASKAALNEWDEAISAKPRTVVKPKKVAKT